MALKAKIEERIRKKEIEIKGFEKDLQLKVHEGRAYIQALQDMIKLLPREQKVAGAPEKILKIGSSPRKAYDYLMSIGKPMHIFDIMKAIGLEVNKQNRAALGSSLNLYVKKNLIFTRPGPGTFGLQNMETEEIELPENFGGNEENQKENEEVSELEPF